MNDLYIVFGSETQLLKDLFEREGVFFIRIYNNRIPSPLTNAIDVNTLDEFKVEFEKVFLERQPKKIIFIGAAFMTQNKLFFQEEQSIVNDILKLNIYDYVSYAHYLLPFMIKIRNGQFVYLSSFRATATCRGVSLYGASKAFGEKFFEILGKENAAFGVYSASIRMGYFDGRMTNVMSAEKIKNFKMSVGNRKLGSSEDLIKAIDFIIGNKYTNGGTIELTGGISFN
jgi:short-subunit dehydrogenase